MTLGKTAGCYARRNEDMSFTIAEAGDGRIDRVTGILHAANAEVLDHLRALSASLSDDRQSTDTVEASAIRLEVFKHTVQHRAIRSACALLRRVLNGVEVRGCVGDGDGGRNKRRIVDTVVRTNGRSDFTAAKQIADRKSRYSASGSVNQDCAARTQCSDDLVDQCAGVLLRGSGCENRVGI